MELTKQHAVKVLAVVDAGLVIGLGTPVLGNMCVEAAVCFALGLPYGDHPACVGAAVCKFKISLNDACWSSNTVRTKGLRKLAIAQLGSDTIDQNKFSQILIKLTIQRLLPFLYRDLAATPKIATHKVELLAAADRCEQDGTKESAWQAQKAAAAASAYAASAYAATCAAAAACATCASAAACAASTYAAACATTAMRDSILFLIADIGLEALKQCESPGYQWLDLVDA